MPFEYGEQRDEQGNVTHAGSWGVKSSPKEAFEKIIENFKILRDEGVTPEQLQVYIDETINTAALDATNKANIVQSNLDTHAGSVNNPHAVTFAQLGVKPTTLAGYGITDAIAQDSTVNTVRVLKDVARYYLATGGISGAIKLTFPSSWVFGMFRVKITGLQWDSPAAWEVNISGVQNASTTKWELASATLSPGCPFTSVRLSHDGTKCCILLGATATIWRYPAIKVEEVQLSYANYATYPATGWALSLITDETGITTSSTPVVKTLAVTDSPIFTGNVGIGTSSPNMKLHVAGETGVGIRIQDTTLGRHTYLTNDSGWFAINAANGNGICFKNQSGNPSVYFTNDKVGIGVSSPTSPLDVSGIITANGYKLPAIQIPSADPNTLDDYEEGTFTPTIVGTTTAGVGTYTEQFGRYTKVGNTVSFKIVLNWATHTGTGNMRINGLPFNSISDGAGTPCSIYTSRLTYTGTPCVTVAPNASYLFLLQLTSDLTSTECVMDTAGVIIVKGQYFTN